MERETNSKSISFANIEFLRYVKIKDSVEDLMKVIDKEKVEQHGKDKVLLALLQLINENHDKLIEEKKESIRDTLYNGNVLSHYFSDENREQAIDILSHIDFIGKEENEAVSEVEQFIFSINFWMPGDEDFIEVHKSCGKNPTKTAEHYGFLNYENAENLVHGRLAEVTLFHEKLEAERERRHKLSVETKNLAAEAELEHSEEEYSDLGTDVSPTATQGADDFVGEDALTTAEPTELTGREIHQTERTNGTDYSPEGRDVMSSIQKLVSDNNHNLGRIAYLEEEVKSRDSQIVQLGVALDEANAVLSEKDKEIKSKRHEIDEKDSELLTIKTELMEIRSAMDDARQSIILRDKTIGEKDVQIADLERTLAASIAEVNARREQEAASFEKIIRELREEGRLKDEKIKGFEELLADMKRVLVASQPEVNPDEIRKSR